MGRSSHNAKRGVSLRCLYEVSLGLFTSIIFEFFMACFLGCIEFTGVLEWQI
jgi:hypothetical protein